MAGNLYATNYKKVYINDIIPTNFQCPTSRESNCSKGQFKNNNNKDFIFTMSGDHCRSELRFIDEFHFAEGTFRELDVKFRIRKLNNATTFVQVHTKGGINKPILRIATHKNRLKLFIYNGHKYIKKTVLTWREKKQIIGKELSFRVVIKNDNLIVYFKNKKLIKVRINIEELNYYKIGAYLQDNGIASTEDYSIKYIKE